MPRLRKLPGRPTAATEEPAPAVEEVPMLRTPARGQKARKCTKCGKSHLPPTGLKCTAAPKGTVPPVNNPQTDDQQIRTQLLQQQQLAQQQALQLQQLQQQLAQQQALQLVQQQAPVPPVTEQGPPAPPRAIQPQAEAQQRVPPVTERVLPPAPPRVPAQVPPVTDQTPQGGPPRAPSQPDTVDPMAKALEGLTAGITAAITQTLLPSLTQSIQQAHTAPHQFVPPGASAPSTSSGAPAAVLPPPGDARPSTSTGAPAAATIAGPSTIPRVAPDACTPATAHGETDFTGEEATGTLSSQLRQDRSLQHQVTGRLTSIGYIQDADPATATAKGKARSGREKTASDLVDVDVERFWPHLQVRGEQGMPLNYEDLTFPQFVQGYTQIIKDTTDPKLKLILLDHLQELAADVDAFPWEWVRGYHAAVLSAMERKRLTWYTPGLIQKLRNQELVMRSARQAAAQNAQSSTTHPPHPQQYRGSKKQDIQVCMPYQQGQCTHNRDHHGFKHCCNYCWVNDGNKFSHTEAACKKKISRKNKKGNADSQPKN